MFYDKVTMSNKRLYPWNGDQLVNLYQIVVRLMSFVNS